MTIATPDVEHAIDMGFTPERFPLGTHMCYLYSDEAERRAVMAQFANRGLEQGEFVGYFADLEDKQLSERHGGSPAGSGATGQYAVYTSPGCLLPGATL
jgi:hypothetical protein